MLMRYLIVNDLDAVQYKALLNYLLESCQHFSVCSFKVHKKELNESYDKFFEDFHYCKCNQYEFSLPQHYEKGQKFFVYDLNKNTKRFISDRKNFLTWRIPDLPEDISFYKNKKVVFATISHEKMFIFYVINEEIKDILNKYGIKIRTLD